MTKNFERPPCAMSSTIRARPNAATTHRLAIQRRRARRSVAFNSRASRHPQVPLEPIGDDVLHHLLTAAHAAPSVGLSQPWRFIVVRSEETKAAMHAIAQRERLVQAAFFPDRSTAFLS